MAITGTGTQADPYIVDSWPDFVTAVGTLGAYVEVAPGLTWDMNEIAPEGISTPITFSAQSINGHGVKIYNLVMMDGGYINLHRNNMIIEDFSILNLYVRSSYFFFITVEKVGISQSVFSGIIQDSTFAYVANVNQAIPSMDRCSMNLRFGGNSLLYNGYYSTGMGGKALRLTNCNVALSGRSTNANSITSYDARNKYNLVSFVNCYISGNNPFKYLYICWNSTYSSSTVYSRYSIFNIICEPGQSIMNAPNSTLITNCLINQDKINEATVNSALTQVTDAQMRDPEYLSSIGFPIGVTP